MNTGLVNVDNGLWLPLNYSTSTLMLTLLWSK